VDWTAYTQFPALAGSIFMGLHNKWLWKGTDAGSSIDDPYKTVEKRFVHGAPLVYTLAPSLSYRGNFVSFMGELTLGDEAGVYLRASFMW
jgi:hypothetical protein